MCGRRIERFGVVPYVVIQVDNIIPLWRQGFLYDSCLEHFSLVLHLNVHSRAVDSIGVAPTYGALQSCFRPLVPRAEGSILSSDRKTPILLTTTKGSDVFPSTAGSCTAATTSTRRRWRAILHVFLYFTEGRISATPRSC